MATIPLPAQLTLREARLALRSLESAISDCADATVSLDAGALSQIDSSVLAVLLSCRRQAQQHAKAFEVINAPQRVLDLATLYGVVDLLALKAADTDLPLR